MKLYLEEISSEKLSGRSRENKREEPNDETEYYENEENGETFEQHSSGEIPRHVKGYRGKCCKHVNHNGKSNQSEDEFGRRCDDNCRRSKFRNHGRTHFDNEVKVLYSRKFMASSESIFETNQQVRFATSDNHVSRTFRQRSRTSSPTRWRNNGSQANDSCICRVHFPPEATALSPEQAGRLRRNMMGRDGMQTMRQLPRCFCEYCMDVVTKRPAHCKYAAANLARLTPSRRYHRRF